jgi:hypothetical protein
MVDQEALAEAAGQQISLVAQHLQLDKALQAQVMLSLPQVVMLAVAEAAQAEQDNLDHQMAAELEE